MDRAWFERKANMVFKLNNRAFSTWEQKPYLLRFPTTARSPAQPPMFQNLTLVPLADFWRSGDSHRGNDHDATDEAMLMSGQRQA